jgi:hypothetical protein
MEERKRGRDDARRRDVEVRRAAIVESDQRVLVRIDTARNTGYDIPISILISKDCSKKLNGSWMWTKSCGMLLEANALNYRSRR